MPYYGYYGGYGYGGYGGYYNNYMYSPYYGNYNLGTDDETETTTTITSEILPYTPLLWQVFIEEKSDDK